MNTNSLLGIPLLVNCVVSKYQFNPIFTRVSDEDPHCPPAVRRAKQLRNAIIELMDGSDLNSPARGTRTDATGMGGESGESSGGSET